MSGFILGRYRESVMSRQSTDLVRKAKRLPKKLHMSKYYTKMSMEWKIPVYGEAGVPLFERTK